MKLICSSFLVILISCSSRIEEQNSPSKKIEIDSTCIKTKLELEEYYAIKDTAIFYLGDIDNDKLPDTAFGVSHVEMKKDSCNNFNKQYIEISFSNSEQKIIQENAFGGLMVNAGKLAGLETSSLFYIPYWNTSNYRAAYIYSFLNNKWEKTGETVLNADKIFEHENPEKLLKSLVFPYKKGSYKLKEYDYWNDSVNEEIKLYKTKIITLKP